MLEKVKKLIPLAVLSCFTLAAVSFAATGTGNSSSTSISYYDTIKYGSAVSMNNDSTVTVSGSLSSEYSDNTLWFETQTNGGTIVSEREASIGFSGTLYSFTLNKATGNYKLALNPDGPNYVGCVGNGTAKN
ncbi:hypothetical protein [Paenibacillus aquistagni]|uniref:hypothetical protein n=1 Tax=Paenibacillus aquistagni TaxID=1852522 RepID=UPI00145A6D73|nr:hypothetical protein [Paenibacillus aquistagni]NMM54840.1 hypothetical protein [Paenibacillus aquistagni]